MSTTEQQPVTTVITPGIYDVDPVHSRVGFSAKHLGINRVRGRFETFEGTVEITGELTTAKIAGVIEAGSVNTHFSMRDDHLRSDAFFDVENHPKISFVVSAITPLDERHFEITGEITIRGVTRAVTFKAQLGGTASDQFGNERLGLSASGELNRSDFGMPYDQAVAGIPVVADTVRFEIDIEALKQP